jgi:hypothetical protein
MLVSELEKRPDRIIRRASMPKRTEISSEFNVVSSVMNECRLYRFIRHEKSLVLKT